MVGSIPRQGRPDCSKRSLSQRGYGPSHVKSREQVASGSRGRGGNQRGVTREEIRVGVYQPTESPRGEHGGGRGVSILERGHWYHELPRRRVGNTARVGARGGAHGQTIQEPLPPKWGGRHPLKLKNGTKQKDRKRANPRSHTEPRGREERRGTRGRVTIRRGGGSVTGVGGDTEMNKNDPPSCSYFSEALSLLTYCVVIASARQWSGSRAQLSL